MTQTRPALPLSQAAIISVLLHGAGFLVLAWFMSTHHLWPKIPSPAPEPPAEIEITVPVSTVEVVPALPSVDRLIKTDGLAASEVAPEDPRYESDRTTRAGSAESADAEGSHHLPGQRGVDIPHISFVEIKADQPTSPLTLVEPETIATSPQGLPTTAPPPIEKKKPATEQPPEEKTRLKSRVDPTGSAGVDAVETSRGHYLSRINRQLQSFWSQIKSQHKDTFTYGTITLELWVREDGTVENASVIDRYGGTAQMEFIMLREVQKLSFPPIPANLSHLLKNKRLRHLPKFTLY